MATMTKEITDDQLREMIEKYLDTLPARLATITLDGAKEFITECARNDGMSRADVSDEELCHLLTLLVLKEQFMFSISPTGALFIVRKHDQEEAHEHDDSSKLPSGAYGGDGG